MTGKGRGLRIAAVVVGLLGVVLLSGAFAYARTAYGTSTVSSSSMSPAYEPGDRIFWERVDGDQIRRGDVVVFSSPERYHFSGVVMQRVIGVGGDRVACCTKAGSQERVTVNGKPIEEPYVSGGDADGVHRPYDVKVPRGRLFLLGDHRSNAMDSRFFTSDHDGTVSVSAVRGRVTEDRTGIALFGTAVILGGVLVLIGVGLGIGAWAVRRRATRVPPAPPWPTQPV
ncbi:signal peptidase I [Streptomyces sp. NPDC058964]|uniref:signal peptidase I n=1 Tax=Streptomyces sp. NPDC058964 TaxID=3346681 RepID=UPI003699312E